MKTKLTLLLVVLLPFAAHAADDLSTALQKGLFEEEANQNLPAAIKAYESLLAASDAQRKLAATALFRLGECYRKLGRTNDAVTQYQRLLRDYADQSTLATLSRQNLRGLGVVPARPPTETDDRAASGISLESRERLRELLESEIRIAGQFAAEQRKKIETGTLAIGDEVRFERDVLGLKRQLVAVDGLSSAEDRQEWRELLLQEIALAEKAVSLERQKLDSGKSVASELARLQRDVLILKRELVAFESTPARGDAATRQAAPTDAAAMTEGIRAETLLAQLKEMHRTELLKVMPTVAPDALLSSLLERLAEAQRKLAAAKTTFNDEHPTTRASLAELKILDEQIVERLQGILKGLEIKVAALKQQTAVAGGTGREDAGATSEVRQEIRRIQDLLKDSPDLVNALNIEITKTPAGPLLSASKGTLLHKAASEGQVAVAKFLIGRGANVDMRDAMSQTPLHWAAGGGHKAMVELLLTNKADVNARSSLGGSYPLHLAVRLGYRAVCEALLAGGADPNLVDGSDERPIFYAVQKNDEPVLRLLLAKGAKVNPEPDKKSGTLLHEVGTTNIAKILIEAGAVVDALDHINRSPLHEKASMGNRAVLDFLLAAGANPNLKDKNGKTPLHLTAANWKANVVAPLIAKGGNPNERNAYGGVPLDELIQFSKINSQEGNRAPQMETLQAFLTGGADPNLIIAGGTPHLFRATSEGLEEQVEALLKAGADPNARSDYDREGTSNLKGQTPLIRALRGTKRPSSGYGDERTRSMAMVNLLLEYKADPNLADGTGNTPLYFAILSGSKEFAEKVPFVEALLNRGANIEGRNSSSDTPLAIAVHNNMKEMVELLLKHKADPNAKTGNGKSLLHLAASNRSIELVEILLLAGADPNALDVEGRSALDYVKTTGSASQPGTFRMVTPVSPIPNFPGQPSSQRKDISLNELADRLRKAGARDWAPRPGLITVTRRSTGVSQVIFTKGTNDWNRHSLLELMGFTYFGSDTKFPFPDLSKVKITRADSRMPDGIIEFTIDLNSALAKDGCQADQWLWWGDLIDIPEGEHKLGEQWSRLGIVEAGAISKCLARSVTIVVKGESNKYPLTLGSWVSELANGQFVYGPERPYRLRRTVLNSGLLLTSSDTTRVKVTRPDSAGGGREWTFNLSKEPSAGNDLWLRDGDVIEVPEKPQ